MPRYRFPAPELAEQEKSALKKKDETLPQCQCALEVQFPHILSAIQALWGFRELNAYFTKLTLDERGNRAGFPKEVWDELHVLLRIHQELMPEPLFATNDSRHALDLRRTSR
jgi:hypothetical protein